jgi:signal peptidase I
VFKLHIIEFAEAVMKKWTTIIPVIAVFILFYLFILTPSGIGGTAMEPTARNGEYVLTSKIQYKFEEPQRGDIIIFKYPKNLDVDFISRIIAISGDTIQIKEGLVYLNGSVLQEPYVFGVTIPSIDEGAIKEGETLKIPADSIFVMSDNRQHSSDSRYFGPVPKNNIVGKALLRLFPFDRLGLITSSKSVPETLSGDDLYKAGLYFLNQKTTTKAEEYFIKAGTEFKYVPAFNELGGIYFQKKDYEKARMYYQNALDIEPENPYALHNMGYAYWNTGDTKKAEEYLKKALAAYEKTDSSDSKEGIENIRTFMTENNIRF